MSFFPLFLKLWAVKDKRLAKEEAKKNRRNDAKKREVGQWSEERNVTAICNMQHESKKVRASGKMAAETGERFLN